MIQCIIEFILLALDNQVMSVTSSHVIGDGYKICLFDAEKKSKPIEGKLDMHKFNFFFTCDPVLHDCLDLNVKGLTFCQMVNLILTGFIDPYNVEFDKMAYNKTFHSGKVIRTGQNFKVNPSMKLMDKDHHPPESLFVPKVEGVSKSKRDSGAKSKRNQKERIPKPSEQTTVQSDDVAGEAPVQDGETEDSPGQGQSDERGRAPVQIDEEQEEDEDLEDGDDVEVVVQEEKGVLEDVDDVDEVVEQAEDMVSESDDGSGAEASVNEVAAGGIHHKARSPAGGKPAKTSPAKSKVARSPAGEKPAWIRGANSREEEDHIYRFIVFHQSCRSMIRLISQGFMLHQKNNLCSKVLCEMLGSINHVALALSFQAAIQMRAIHKGYPVNFLPKFPKGNPAYSKELCKLLCKFDTRQLGDRRIKKEKQKVIWQGKLVQANPFDKVSATMNLVADKVANTIIHCKKGDERSLFATRKFGLNDQYHIDNVNVVASELKKGPWNFITDPRNDPRIPIIGADEVEDKEAKESNRPTADEDEDSDMNTKMPAGETPPTADKDEDSDLNKKMPARETRQTADEDEDKMPAEETPTKRKRSLPARYMDSVVDQTAKRPRKTVIVSEIAPKTSNPSPPPPETPPLPGHLTLPWKPPLPALEDLTDWLDSNKLNSKKRQGNNTQQNSQESEDSQELNIFMVV
jgi:hypothetical protein